MQLSRLYSALFRSPSSLRALGSTCLSTSVLLIGASQVAWAQTEPNTDTQSDPSVVLDTIVVTSSADASADGLPTAYEGGQ
ncbi:MAG: TonB-dependent siderophore receptor, partial [Psychrobacter alimentarius]